LWCPAVIELDFFAEYWAQPPRIDSQFPFGGIQDSGSQLRIEVSSYRKDGAAFTIEVPGVRMLPDSGWRFQLLNL